MRACVLLTGEVRAVPLLKDAVRYLLAGCRLVDVAVESPERVVLDDPSNQLTRLTWEEKQRDVKVKHPRQTRSRSPSPGGSSRSGTDLNPRGR